MDGRIAEGDPLPSGHHNGILVDNPPRPPYDGQGADVSDDQISEILTRCGVTARYAWDLGALVDQLAAAKNTHLQQPPSIYREITRGLDGVLSLWPIVGDAHWRALMLDSSTRSIYLFDSYGADGWKSTRGTALKNMLKDLQLLLRFSLVTLDFRVQGCNFQCGCWVIWFLLTGATWSSQPHMMLTFQEYLAQEIAAQGISTRRPKDNRTFAFNLRKHLRQHVTNPRSRGEPALGVYSTMSVHTRQPDHFSSLPPYYFIKGLRMPRFPLDDGSAPPPTVHERMVCNRDNCSKDWLGCCSLPNAPSREYTHLYILHHVCTYIYIQQVQLAYARYRQHRLYIYIYTGVIDASALDAIYISCAPNKYQRE